MKKQRVWIRYVATALLLLMGVALLSACGTTYRSDVSAETLMQAAISAISEESGDYYMADGDTYAIYFDQNAAYAAVQNCCIAYHSVGTNVDQIGVFLVKDAQSVEAVRKMVQEYVDGQCEYLYGFAENYNKDELDKIQNQQLTVMGQYVCFTILNDGDERAVLQAIEAAITD